MAEAASYPALTNIDTRLKLNKPEIKVSVNREKAADLGIPVESIGRTLETMLGGRQVTRFKQNGKQYEVVVQVADIDRNTTEDMWKIYMRSSSGPMVQLSNLMTVRDTLPARQITHRK